jgi:hypothetical protein
MVVKKKKKYVMKINFPIDDFDAISKLWSELRYENRFFLSTKPSILVKNLIWYAKEYKTHEFSNNSILYRARINDLNKKNHELKDMGAPPPEKAIHNRINPVGIPYLYLANDIETAVAEIRPWIGCKITVAEYQLIRDIKVINFSNKRFIKKPEDRKYEGVENTWQEIISHMFSMPFDPRDDTGYIPLQYISERIKH